MPAVEAGPPTPWQGWGSPPPGWSPEQAPPGPSSAPSAQATPPASPRDREQDPIVGGIVLIAIGGLLLVGNWISGLASLVPLAVGVVLLVLFAARRRYGLLVAGCIVSGVGAGVALASRLGGPEAGALVLLSMAGGFASIWLVARLAALPEPAAWSLVPAAILGSIGALLLAGVQGVDVGDWWPLILVGLGVLVIAGSLGRRPR